MIDGLREGRDPTKRDRERCSVECKEPGANSAAQVSRWVRKGGAGEYPGVEETVGDGGMGTVWLRSRALGATMP